MTISELVAAAERRGCVLIDIEEHEQLCAKIASLMAAEADDAREFDAVFYR
ncbi:hypothetical protein BN1232_02254 [Mycobacterium lentiflavum]|uniref:Uncharacterized protein n=1 Tax=Mycobacterium lentiflavum TaxID=141349 RepID=A0A0E3WC39_MYCLN|nr:hypothetical protein [Mycobacterium lentiflavum]CQD11944.1 hypothetical protein BN1232_02254 [Mycobacterium lentiflavum]